MKEYGIKISEEKCTGCNLCIEDCPSANIILKNEKAVLKSQSCIKCGHCVAVCPQGAVSMTGFDEEPMEFEENTIVDKEQLLKALKTRRSIRKFKNKPISKEVVESIIEAGRWTPTAKNAQGVSYIILKKEKDKCEKVAVELFRKFQGVLGILYPPGKDYVIDDNFFFKKAPLAIMIISNNKLDGGLAASNMALMAEANGLGVLYSGFFTIAANQSKKLRRMLKLDKNNVVTTLVLGYPDVKYYRTVQKKKAKVRYL